MVKFSFIYKLIDSTISVVEIRLLGLQDSNLTSPGLKVAGPVDVVYLAIKLRVPHLYMLTVHTKSEDE